ncbi:MAG: hypothetical protein NXI27_25590 [Alphaproteobacteria bacterium]|nr:hypothetical protein [Alphaproteobacteria bacterium]
MPDFSVPDSGCEAPTFPADLQPQCPNSAVILCFAKENKTRTKTGFSGDELPCAGTTAAALGIRRTWRQVVDFGDPKSSGIGDAWGFKTVSVPWVSILDGPPTDGEPSSS